jgi:hypothetical protein
MDGRVWMEGVSLSYVYHVGQAIRVGWTLSCLHFNCRVDFELPPLTIQAGNLSGQGRLVHGRPNYAASWSKAPSLIPSPLAGERAG